VPPQFVGGPTYPFTGYTIRFTEKKLKQLYPTHDEYVEKVKAAAEAATIPEPHRPNLNKQRLP